MTQPDSAPTGLHPNRIWPPDTTSDLLKTRKPSAWFQVDSRGVGPARWPGKQKTARRRGRAVLQKSILLIAPARRNRRSLKKRRKANAANAITILYLPPAQLDSEAGGRFI
jgi:hypothetical protein